MVPYIHYTAKVNREIMELAKELVGQEGLEPSFLGDWIQVPSPLLNFLRNNIFKQTINL